MFVGSVCTQPPHNDKNPPSVFFLSIKIFTSFSNRTVCPCDVDTTESCGYFFGVIILSVPGIISYSFIIMKQYYMIYEVRTFYKNALDTLGHLCSCLLCILFMFTH